MSDQNTFADFLAKVRQRDEKAWVELVDRYGEPICRAVRMHIRNDRRLQRIVDSIDICQSVLLNFSLRAALGQFDLATPQQLLNLLKKMARNRLATIARQPNVVRYKGGTRELEGAVARDSSPSSIISREERSEERRVGKECRL